MGRLLRVNLTERKHESEEIPSSVMERYVGGKGLAAYYLYREVPAGCDPLGPENKLAFFVGPLTGLFPGHDRYVVAAKSPQTNTFSDSYAGGWFSVACKRAGLMGLILEGRADAWVVLKIDGDKVSVEDATEYAGMSPSQVDKALPGFRVAAIGKAGENLVKYACVISNAGKAGRAGVAGRGGLGAVMGSKRLKAIAIRSDQDNIAEMWKKTAEVRKRVTKHLTESVVPGMGIGGNLGVVDLSATVKVLPVRNFTRGYLPQYVNINQSAVEKTMVKKSTCHLCPAACGVQTEIKDGPYRGVRLDRLEYETVAMCGSNCGHTELGPIVYLNYLCNEYGLDTISAGNVVGFFMECAERGLVDQEIQFGDANAHVDLLGKIARREGVGDLLAEGVRAAAREFGKQAESIAVHVKGLEIPGYDPRGSASLGLSYGTADRGGDHLRAWSIASEAFLNAQAEEQVVDPFSTEGKAKLVKNLQDSNAALWTLLSCDNLGFSFQLASEMLGAIGILTSEEMLQSVGERIYNLTRLFNCREGFSRKDDYLPDRFYQPRDDTGWNISRQDYDRMLDEYYRLRGWDSEGKPTDVLLEKLGITP